MKPLDLTDWSIEAKVAENGLSILEYRGADDKLILETCQLSGGSQASTEPSGCSPQPCEFGNSSTASTNRACSTDTKVRVEDNCATHLLPLLNTELRGPMIENTAALLRKHEVTHPFDAIAVSGVSGLLIGLPVAMAVGKELLVIRKSDELRHSWRLIEGGKYESAWNAATQSWDYKPRSYRVAILDDLIDSGATIDYMVDCLLKTDGDCKYRAEHSISAIFLYNPDEGNLYLDTRKFLYGHKCFCAPIFCLPFRKRL